MWQKMARMWLPSLCRKKMRKSQTSQDGNDASSHTAQGWYTYYYHTGYGQSLPTQSTWKIWRLRQRRSLSWKMLSVRCVARWKKVGRNMYLGSSSCMMDDGNLTSRELHVNCALGVAQVDCMQHVWRSVNNHRRCSEVDMACTSHNAIWSPIVSNPLTACIVLCSVLSILILISISHSNRSIPECTM